MKLHISWAEFLDLLPRLLPFLLPILVLYLALTIAAVVSLLRKKLPFGQIAGWLVIIVLCNLVGPVLYFAVGSRLLDEKVDAGRESEHERD